MTTATVEMTRDGAYVVVMFRPKAERRPMPGSGIEELVLPSLPSGLFDFATKGFRCDSRGVAIRLDKDKSGGVNVLDMLVAADWLRDQGWTVEPLGWCATVFERVEGTAEK